MVQETQVYDYSLKTLNRNISCPLKAPADIFSNSDTAAVEFNKVHVQYSHSPLSASVEIFAITLMLRDDLNTK